MQRAETLAGVLAQTMFERAIALHGDHRLKEAQGLYRAVLCADPGHAGSLYRLGLLAGAPSRHGAARTLIERALAVKADDADALSYLGLLRREAGDLQAAMAAYRAALVTRPESAEGWTRFGNTLSQLGKAEAGRRACARATLLNSALAVSHLNLGVTHIQLAQFPQALRALRRAAVLKPGMPRVYANIATTLHSLGRTDNAIAASRIAIRIAPWLAEAYFTLAVALNHAKRRTEALAAYDRTIELQPGMAGVHANRASILMEEGRYEEGARACLVGLCVAPSEAKAYCNLSALEFSLGRLHRAVIAADRSLKITPDLAAAHFNRANALCDLARFREAHASHSAALCVDPGFAFAYGNIATVLQGLGRTSEAVTLFERALTVSPDLADAKSGLLFLLASRDDVSQSDYLARAKDLNTPRQPRRAPDEQAIFPRQHAPGRPLRVGYVSGDYRQHSVSYFIEQLFTRHDRARVTVVAYPTSGREDAVTDRLRPLADRWVPLTGLTGEAARALIIEDEIDVLIDLSGHTKHNRLDIFSTRAAPVQAHYLGFFASTGLAEMDYWIADEVLIPPDQDIHFSETVWRLPRSWVSYDARKEAPTPAWWHDGETTLWLGSFNNLYKLNARTLELWAGVLRALPHARLLLKSHPLSDAGNRQKLLDSFADRGIGEERLALRDGSDTADWASHMAYYNHLDIALDPIGGVGGGTTTCDALWMGVPVVGLKGDRMGTRMTMSMLHSIGRPEWIAEDEQGYIDTVAELGHAVDLRRAVRREQRQRMAESALCDTAGLARSLEDAYETMLRRRTAPGAISPV